MILNRNRFVREVTWRDRFLSVKPSSEACIFARRAGDRLPNTYS
jgi:hypothetical protein